MIDHQRIVRWGKFAWYWLPPVLAAFVAVACAVDSKPDWPGVVVMGALCGWLIGNRLSERAKPASASRKYQHQRPGKPSIKEDHDRWQELANEYQKLAEGIRLERLPGRKMVIRADDEGETQ